jgi:probable HAF family extracellular repeat protein
MMDLGPILDPRGANATVVAISDSGLVTGTAEATAGIRHAFLWQGGVMTDLGVLPGGELSTATAINSSGRVVGTSIGPSGDSHAFLACPMDSSTGSP